MSQYMQIWLSECQSSYRASNFDRGQSVWVAWHHGMFLREGAPGAYMPAQVCSSLLHLFLSYSPPHTAPPGHCPHQWGRCLREFLHVSRGCVLHLEFPSPHLYLLNTWYSSRVYWITMIPLLKFSLWSPWTLSLILFCVATGSVCGYRGAKWRLVEWMNEWRHGWMDGKMICSPICLRLLEAFPKPGLQKYDTTSFPNPSATRQKLETTPV